MRFQLLFLTLILLSISCEKEIVHDSPIVEIFSPVQGQKFKSGKPVLVEAEISSSIGIHAIKMYHEQELIGITKYAGLKTINSFDDNMNIVLNDSFELKDISPGVLTFALIILDKNNLESIKTVNYFIE